MNALARIVRRLACLLGFHTPRHWAIGGDALTTCLRPGCQWMRTVTR